MQEVDQKPHCTGQIPLPRQGTRAAMFNDVLDERPHCLRCAALAGEYIQDVDPEIWLASAAHERVHGCVVTRRFSPKSHVQRSWL
ncbi:hypothetical protein WK65_14320 [Burkholderia ubonensis]|nr:hypothetical protein WK65_14320 [Burkholderia ubonensis]